MKKASFFKGEKLIKSSVTILIAILSIFMLIPLIWMISTSMKFEVDVFTYPIQWIPIRWNAFNNYYIVIVKNKFFLSYLNSFLYSGGSVIISLITCSMCGYAFGKINFKYRDLLFLGYLSLMMIPPQLTLIPRFMIIKQLGLYDSIAGLVLMDGFSIYGVFLMRQFMITIPESISESAKIDGANHFQIFTKIIVPMMKPALATLGILKFVWSWNDFQGPLIFLKSRAHYTIQLAIQQFSLNDGLSPVYSLIMAASVLATIPIIIVFIIFQRQVVEGLTVGAVKG